MKMKKVSLSFFIFATVFLLSTALPEFKEKDSHSLVNSESNRENEKPLQRRRPPIKIPGPKLTPDESNSGFLTGNDSKMKQLSNEDKGKKKDKKEANLTKENQRNKDMSSLDNDSKKDEKEKKGKKDKNLVGRDSYNVDKEETQEERSSVL